MTNDMLSVAIGLLTLAAFGEWVRRCPTLRASISPDAPRGGASA